MAVKNIKAFSLSENTEGSIDPIRNTIQSFWTYDGSELTYDTRNLYNSSNRDAKTALLDFKFKNTTGPTSWSTNDIALDEDTVLKLRSTDERLSITPRYLSESIALEKNGPTRSKVDPEKQFDTYIENSIIPSLGSTLREYKLDLDSPVEYASKIDNNSVIAGTVNFVYNYGLETYEDRIQESSISEPSLRNFYKFSPQPKTQSVFTNLPVEKRVKRITKRVVRRSLKKFPVSPDNIQDFFMNSDGFLEALGLQEKKDTFPFYNEVYFTNPADKLENDKFKETLNSTGLLISFCDLMNREDYTLSSGQQDQSVVKSSSFANSYLSSSYETNMQEAFTEQSAIKTSLVKIYDMPQMLKVMHDAIPKLSMGIEGSRKGEIANKPDTRTLRDKGFLTDGEQADYRLDTISKIKPVSSISIDYENALDDLVTTINELMSNFDNFKSYREVLEGQDTTYQSDVLFYRIKKYEEGSDTPIQNFWIPAEKGYRGIRYIDTQVKYGKMYRYEIYAFKFVIGAEYEFLEDDAGIINFSEDLQDLISDKEEDLENIIVASSIKGGVEEATSEFTEALPSELGFSTPDTNKILAATLAEFLRSNNLIDSGFRTVEDYTGIFLFAQSIEQLGSGRYSGNKISKEELTQGELEKLEVIRQSWACLTNTNGTDPSKLAELEISINRVIALSNIKIKIVEALEKDQAKKDASKTFLAMLRSATSSFVSAISSSETFATAAKEAVEAAQREADKISLGNDYINYTDRTLENLDKKELQDLYTGIKKLTSSPRAPLTTSTGNYSISLSDPVTFDYDDEFNLTNNRLRLALASTFDDRGDSKESRKDWLNRKRKELRDTEKEFENQSLRLLSLVDDYLGCYQDFIEAAAGFNIVLDYKRINQYSLTVRTRTALKLAELPYYQSEGMILDNPPIYPNVNVITYRGIADRLSFFMNSGQGQIEISPITFSSAEDTFMADYRKSRKLNDFQPILYKSDETENLGTIFEIRRLSIAPEDYESFRNARVINTSNSIDSGTIPAATYDDQINSNTKYYYIFRVADRRGAISYPSGVMEIEIIENSGIIYPVIKPYEFPKQKTDTTKNLKRLLNIVPRITQVLPPRERASYKTLTAGSTSVLGREEEGLFGKQFKLRLTSKKTGKAVDLNLNFKATVVERAEAE